MGAGASASGVESEAKTFDPALFDEIAGQNGGAIPPGLMAALVAAKASFDNDVGLGLHEKAGMADVLRAVARDWIPETDLGEGTVVADAHIETVANWSTVDAPAAAAAPAVAVARESVCMQSADGLTGEATDADLKAAAAPVGEGYDGATAKLGIVLPPDVAASCNAAKSVNTVKNDLSASLTEIFRKLDVDHSDFIERNELKKMLTMLGLSSEDAAVERMEEANALEEADTAGDGKISLEEFKTYMAEQLVDLDEEELAAVIAKGTA